LIKLGALELPGHLVRDGEFDQIAAHASIETSLDGSEIAFVQAASGGDQIDLIAETPHFTRAQIVALTEMSRDAAATYELISGADVSIVRFRYENAPVIEVTPVPSRPEYTDDDNYSGRIKLKEV
jgi:hypothetical protein